MIMTLVAQTLKNLPARRPGLSPWVRKIPWRRKWQPTPVFLPGESLGWRSLAGCSPQGHTELDTTKVTQHAHRRQERFEWSKLGLERGLIRSVILNVWSLRCLLGIKMEMSHRQLNIQLNVQSQKISLSKYIYESGLLEP